MRYSLLFMILCISILICVYVDICFMSCVQYMYILFFFDAENNTDYNVKKMITIFIFSRILSPHF